MAIDGREPLRDRIGPCSEVEAYLVDVELLVIQRHRGPVVYVYAYRFAVYVYGFITAER
jgi:hypothetical protein